MANRFKLDTQDGKNAWKVLLYSVASSIIASLILWVSDVEFPRELVAFIPIINVILVAAKDFFEKR
jgi:hypothetical protein